MKNHEFIGISTKGRFCIKGIDVFKYHWDTLGDVAVVLHPKSKKTYSFSAYQISVGDENLKFIAGKFEDDTWGFYQYS